MFTQKERDYLLNNLLSKVDGQKYSKEERLLLINIKRKLELDSLEFFKNSQDLTFELLKDMFVSDLQLPIILAYGIDKMGNEIKLVLTEECISKITTIRDISIDINSGIIDFSKLISKTDTLFFNTINPILLQVFVITKFQCNIESTLKV